MSHLPAASNACHRPFFRPQWLDNTMPQALCSDHAQALHRAMLAAYNVEPVTSEGGVFVSTFVNTDELQAPIVGNLPAWLYPKPYDQPIAVDDCPDCWLANAFTSPDDTVWTHPSGWTSIGITTADYLVEDRLAAHLDHISAGR